VVELVKAPSEEAQLVFGPHSYMDSKGNSFPNADRKSRGSDMIMDRLEGNEPIRRYLYQLELLGEV
jgi:hypothetical protein